MTSQASLLDMPDLVIKKILNKSEYRSILVLRKVCRDIRNFIDDVRPECFLESVEIGIGATKQRIKEIALSITSSKENHIISFRNHQKGCQILCGRKKKILENLKYSDVFFEDLDFILKNHNATLKIFRINISSQDSELLEKLNTVMKSRKLQVQYLSIQSDKEHVLEILPHIAVKPLKRIELRLTKPAVVKIEELENLDQWYETEELFTEGLTFSASVEHFSHFSRAEVTLLTVTVEGLFLLKEKFLTSPNFKHCIIHYRHFADDGASDLRRRIHEMRKLNDLLGMPFLDHQNIREKHCSPCSSTLDMLPKTRPPLAYDFEPIQVVDRISLNEMSPNLLSRNPTDVIILPSSPPSLNYSLMSKESCKVCDDRVNNCRYGAPACLGCTVFFRRTIVKNMKYSCLKQQNCTIHYSYRCACRYCRFQKCLKAGMRGSAIQRRDVLGPRNEPKEKLVRSPDVVLVDDETDTFLISMAEFQRLQFLEHLPFFAENHVDVAIHKDQSNFVKYRRRARAHDVDVMLKLCLKQAIAWGDRLKPFRRLSWGSKKSILAEYCLAFLLIDQGFKTSKEADQGIWLLQNGSFMHPDYFFGLPQATIDMESMRVKTQLHHNYVSELLYCIATPFRKLEIDEIECAVLKTILLLKPSCSERAVYSGQEGVLAGIYTKCMDELMEHSTTRFPDRSAERFGEILLLTSSIRCGVKALYNQTRVSDLLNFMNFDESVRDILLT